MSIGLLMCLLPVSIDYTYDEWQYETPGDHLTMAYNITIQRYRNSHAKIENSKMHILQYMGSKLVPFEISHKLLNPYTANYTIYKVLKVWQLMIS